MTLSPPANRVQQLSSSSPNAAALRAATLSFGKKPPPAPRQTPNARNPASRNSRPSSPGNITNENPLLAAQQSLLKEQVPSRSPASMLKGPLHLRSLPIVAASLATSRSGSPPKKSGKRAGEGEEEEFLPVKGPVNAQQRLFYGGDARQDDPSPSPIASAQLPRVSPTRSRSPGFQGVDATSLDDISSLKTLFEKSVSRQTSTAQSTQSAPPAPKPAWPVASPDNPSLTAAILATQLPSSNPAQNSRRSSPILNPVPTSTHRSPTQALLAPSLPPPHDGLRVSRTGISSREPMVSKVSSRNSALLAATLASKPKTLPIPQTKIQPPKPPPPRAQTGLKAATTIPGDKVSDPEDDSDCLSINSATTGYSKYNTAQSSMSPKFGRLPASNTSLFNLSSLSAPPPPPRRRRSIGQLSRQSTGDISSAALAAAVLSAASSRNVSSSPAHTSHNLQPASLVPRHLTGDSSYAVSLAPTRVASPAPNKPPVPPAPRRGRRRSLPPPPKTGLRETMRKPPKTATKDISPQRRKPHLVKHHPHKHSEGERRRWRHFVTESERRRYEGLWAANKGFLLVDINTDLTTTTATSFSVSPRTKSHGPHNFQQQQHVWSSTPNYTELLVDCIDSVIARDIWARSRLPFDHLADVWDLVDRGEKGRLSRDEFVVGTWLVDQSLKGRKLPSKVQDEVWQSVRRLGIQTKPVN